MRILTDPLLRGRILGIIKRRGPEPSREVRRDVGAVLISHAHPDHLDFPSLRAVGRGTLVVGPPGIAGALRRRRFRRVRELGAGEAVELEGVRITGTPAVHDGRRFKIGPARAAVGFEIQGGGQRVYYAGDTDLFDGMRQLAGGLDVALLPVGGWGPKVGSGHLDAARAAKAAAMLQPRLVVPVHWGTYLRADLHRRRPELLTGPARELEAELAKAATGARACVLEPGSSLDLDTAS